ncbi:MAG TPA: polysaccharide deacetylase family protein [Kiritimatiellia bacterium]|nr:polysaccharide deacetylase family protein [Kiritimatiellia bacterium]
MNLKLTWEKNTPDLRALFRGGFPTFVTSSHPPDSLDVLPVFCYHAIHPGHLADDLSFLVRNRYQTLTASHVLDLLEKKAPLPPRSIVLTVDDGASDLYQTLYPALSANSLKAIAFVATAFHSDTYDLPDHARPCSWTELNEMNRSGTIDVQAHTHTHRYIPHWPRPLDLVGIDPAYSRAIQAQPLLSLRDDLAASKAILEDKLGKFIEHLAFPMYTGTPEAVDLARDLGYRGLWWGTLPGRPGNRPGDPATHIVRLSAEWIRRLPGEGRLPLRAILAMRLRKKTINEKNYNASS